MDTRLVGNTHVVAGGPEMLAAVYAYLPKVGIETHANPDFFAQSYKRYGAEEARELRSRAMLRAVGKRRAFVIATADITAEAQNILLKTLEEPLGDALFIFIVPSPQTLLPTFLSRAQILDVGEGKRIADIVDAKTFLAAPPQKRLDMLKPLLEKDEDEKRNLGAILAFLSAVEIMVGKSARASGARAGLESIYRARKYIIDKGALVKPLLEQVALLIPNV